MSVRSFLSPEDGSHFQSPFGGSGVPLFALPDEPDSQDNFSFRGEYALDELSEPQYAAGRSLKWTLSTLQAEGEISLTPSGTLTPLLFKTGALSSAAPPASAKDMLPPEYLPIVGEPTEIRDARIAVATTRLEAVQEQLANVVKRVHEFNVYFANQQGTGWLQMLENPAFKLVNAELIAMHFAVHQATEALWLAQTS